MWLLSAVIIVALGNRKTEGLEDEHYNDNEVGSVDQSRSVGSSSSVVKRNHDHKDADDGDGDD